MPSSPKLSIGGTVARIVIGVLALGPCIDLFENLLASSSSFVIDPIALSIGFAFDFLGGAMPWHCAVACDEGRSQIVTQHILRDRLA